MPEAQSLGLLHGSPVCPVPVEPDEDELLDVLDEEVLVDDDELEDEVLDVWPDDEVLVDEVLLDDDEVLPEDEGARRRGAARRRGGAPPVPPVVPDRSWSRRRSRS